jgi:hypothetical protein
MVVDGGKKVITLKNNGSGRGCPPKRSIKKKKKKNKKRGKRKGKKDKQWSMCHHVGGCEKMV